MQHNTSLFSITCIVKVNQYQVNNWRKAVTKYVD